MQQIYNYKLQLNLHDNWRFEVLILFFSHILVYYNIQE